MNLPTLPLDGHDLVTLLLANVALLAAGGAAALLWWRHGRGRPLEIAAVAVGMVAVLLVLVTAWAPLSTVKPPTAAQLRARRQADAQIAARRAQPGYRRWYPPSFP